MGIDSVGEIRGYHRHQTHLTVGKSTQDHDTALEAILELVGQLAQAVAIQIFDFLREDPYASDLTNLVQNVAAFLLGQLQLQLIDLFVGFLELSYDSLHGIFQFRGPNL